MARACKPNAVAFTLAFFYNQQDLIFENLLKTDYPDPSWGTARNPFQFARVLPPQKKDLFPETKRSWIREKGEDSWKRALRSGQVQPATLQEWKEVHWGALPLGRAQTTDQGICFQSQGIPAALWQYLQAETANHLVLASRSEEDFSCACIHSTKTVCPADSLLDFARALQEENLRDFFDCRLRTTAHIVRGKTKDLLQGKRVQVEIWGQKLFLQQEDFLHSLHADLVLETWEDPRDVVLVNAGEWRFWLDLVEPST